MSLYVPPVDTWLRILRTTRHLRSSQIACRMRRMIGQRFAMDLRRASPDNESLGGYVVSPCFPNVPDLSRGCLSGDDLVIEIQRNVLTLVNRCLPLDPRSPDWRLGTQNEDRLWTITLHYHAWLFELAKLIGSQHVNADSVDRTFQFLLQDWLRTCALGKPGVDSLAWNSYAIATRLGWWARIWQGLGEGYWSHHAELAEQVLRSMFAQAKHLAAHLEWDLRANHLLRDAVGLAWAGRFFQGREADHWLKTATTIAVAQADEQLLSDGGHFERSLFYHLEVMDDWLTLACLLRDDDAREKMQTVWERAAEYVRWVRHPDGRVVQFNDGATTIAEPHLSRGVQHSWRVDESPPRGGHWFPDSGVVAWHGTPWTVFWDVGDIGPDCQPGHAHADSLTFEASFGGHRLFVDPGCHSYDDNATRQYDRATSSHNTVSIDGENSSEVWHIFRVGRRARPRNQSISINPTGFQGVASHTGYAHLRGRPQHTRAMSLHNDILRIEDTVSGNGRHVAEGGLLVHPDWEVVERPDGWSLNCGDLRVAVRVSATAPITRTTHKRPIHPDYGVELITRRLTWRFEGHFPLTVSVCIEPA